jgi:hypothetical protein
VQEYNAQIRRFKVRAHNVFPKDEAIPGPPGLFSAHVIVIRTQDVNHNMHHWVLEPEQCEYVNT